MFDPVESSVSFPRLEEKIIAFWREQRIYEQSLAARVSGPEFVFFEGPPTANGLPHPGHCLTRAIKDVFPRYKTMRGFRCRRKAGWDTHGLPVEVEVCKELGIHSKEEIEAYGIEPFIRLCIESVFRYTRQWEQLTERLGFWIHLNEAYVTFHRSYVESVWWSLKNLFDRDLLYQGHKIVWWWAQGGTALSSGEVGQGYREVADPSVYVRFPIVDPPTDLGGVDLTDTDLLVWTTTPWTLPSNQFAAVHPELEYSVCTMEGSDRKLVLASALVETIAAKVKTELTVTATIKGQQLIGLQYVPPFDCYYKTLGGQTGTLKSGGKEPIAWRVVGAAFVTIDSGTGLVHQAPAFGEVDYDVLIEQQDRFVQGEGPELICAVGPDGKFTDELPAYKGRWVKEADKDLSRELRERGILFHLDQYLHDYPFCWRAEQDPLIQYPRKSWFIRTTKFRDRMLENNSKIGWLPEHIRDGRFGNFLESNVDWALSRERYWGTPLPIWVCEETGYQEAIGSYDELLAKPGLEGTEVWEAAKAADPELPDDLIVHKPYIDAITYDSPKAEGARMRRVTEVIDCWYDSGAMPFAQWGYPLKPGSDIDFREQFPADFISEALDQTRGWFYSLTAISTMLFSEDSKPVGEGSVTNATELTKSGEPYPHPFRNCIVLGLMLGEDGQKMSKQKRNYREPTEIFDKYGADALRWYFYANQPPWTAIRYDERAIKESIPEMLLTLWNCYTFLVIYGNIDGFDPGALLQGEAGQLDASVLANAEGYRPVSKRREIDRWLYAELNQTITDVTRMMDAYDNYGATGRLQAFVDGLSNWYVRRCRDRFWSSEMDQDKMDAYWTLYECLITSVKLLAPFVPFLTEAIWQNLVRAPLGDRAIESVHLCDYPEVDEKLLDPTLCERMALAREIVSLALSARMSAKLKVRQPLSSVEVVLTDDTHREWLESHSALICAELNVKRVELTTEAQEYITYSVVPDFKRLGPRLGKNMPAIKKLLGEADGGKLLAEIESAGKIVLTLPDGADVELDSDDIEVRLQAKEGWTAAQGRRCVIVLSTELTEELVSEGYARELVRVIQDRRKQLDCEYTDRIAVGIVTESAPISKAVEGFTEYIKSETLSVDLSLAAVEDAEGVEVTPAGESLTVYVKVVESDGDA